MVNRSDRLVEQPGQVIVYVESRAEVSAQGFWKRETTTMFDIRIVNFDAGSYLRMTPEKDLAKAEKKKKDSYLQACWIVEGLLLLWSTLRTEYQERRPLSVQNKLAKVLNYKLKQ